MEHSNKSNNGEYWSSFCDKQRSPNPITTSAVDLTTEPQFSALATQQDDSTLMHDILTVFELSQSWDLNDSADIMDFNESFLTTENLTFEFNVSDSDKDIVSAAEFSVATMIAIAIVLGFVIMATVIGNVFVIAAILIERNLQNVANYLILSLAVADLLVACLVMPLGAVYEVSQQWSLGPELCDMWTSSDVLCCTASILHLVAIALDRYWAVTNIDYIHQRTAKRIGTMILVVWTMSFMVCIAPLLGWKDPDWERRVVENLDCLVSQDIGYQIFATASSFYLPLLVILILYWRIFQTARKRIRRRQQVNAAIVPGATMATLNPAAGGVIASASGGIAAAVVAVIGRPLPTMSETTTTAMTNVSSSPERNSCGNGIDPDMVTAECSMTQIQDNQYYKKKSRDAANSKRERKAAKTLAIITGAFVICWMPFFVLAILLPTCQDCNLSPHLMGFFLWLGYFNSTLNPIIYTIFSPEFRNAFKRLLCGRRNNLQRRNRHIVVRH